MIKAVNMKSYRFGKYGNIEYHGFGMLDTETDSFCFFRWKNSLRSGDKENHPVLHRCGLA